MLGVEIDRDNGLAILAPAGPLSKNDFDAAARVIDAFIAESGHLNGLVIHAASFPGWDSFAALLAHLGFVQDHHKKVSRVAFATDSLLGNLAETVASHFVSAEIKLFPYQALEQARHWAGAAGKKPA